MRGVFSALLDTCVLWPSTQRDYLLSLAAEGVYRPLWSDAILEELEECEAEKLVRRGIADRVDAEVRAAQLLTRMREAFDDACVVGWEPLEGVFGLPDPDDEHVLAAAVMGHAGAIVTDNARDFPDALLPLGIETMSAKEFATSQTALSPRVAARAVREMAARSGSRGVSRTEADILEVLERRYDLGEVASLVGAVLDRR